MKKTENNKGFSLLEVMLVIVLIATALGFSVLYSQTSQLRADLNTQGAVLVSYLRLAQSNARAGLTDSENAIHFDGDSYTIFSGDTYSALDPTNYTIDLPPTLAIENINLNGAGSDLIFLGPDGSTANFGSLDLRSSRIGKTLTINISSLGTVNY